MKPSIVITPGDPRGIGPEITIRACEDATLTDRAHITIYGSSVALSHAVNRWGNTDRFEWTTGGQHSRNVRVALFDPHTAPNRTTTPEIAPEVTAIREGVEGCLRGDFHALVTGPITKQRLLDRGFLFPGHTQYLAHLTNSPVPVMAFVSNRLRIALVTNHIPLSAVPQAVTEDGIVEVARICAEALKDLFGIATPRLALCGLNPHAGEDGHLGTEDKKTIAPAVQRLRGMGVACDGPSPADSVFSQAIGGKYDLVVAMYHDQGLIPVKLLGRGASVHLTLGLPIIRTSVDHGTALDIAGLGIADPAGMRAAIEEAIHLSGRNLMGG